RHQVGLLADRQWARVREQLDPVSLHGDPAGSGGGPAVAVRSGLAVAGGGDGPEGEQRQQDRAQGHRPYARAISALIRANGSPAFTMRDASSASSMQMLQVAAWPSVKQDRRLLCPRCLSHSQ